MSITNDISEIEKSYESALAILDEALTFGIHPSLDGIACLMERMGEPCKDYHCLHVAGTNGKTSTVRLCAAILVAHGLKTGLYTSPHLVEYPERIEIDGKVIDHDLFAQAVLLAKGAADSLEDIEITEFELITAAAFWAFSAQKVDVAVLECGMGGRWDSTNIVDSDVAVITGIGLDHLGILGNTVEEIAAEKAAIIKEGNTRVVLGPGTAATIDVFMNRCQELGLKPWLVRSESAIDAENAAGQAIYKAGYTDEPGEIFVDIIGVYGVYSGIKMHSALYQAQNIATAIVSCELYLGHALDLEATRKAIENFAVPGRFETLSKDPLLIVDAAHNPQSAINLATACAKRFPQGGFQLLLAVLSDKDARGIIEALAGLTPDIAVTQTSSPRAIEYKQLAEMVEEMTGTAPEIFENPEVALEELLSRGVPVVASGSITLAGEVKGIWRGKYALQGRNF